MSDLEAPSVEKVVDALQKAASEPTTKIIESGLFHNEPRTKNCGNAQKIEPGKSEPVLEVYSKATSDARTITVQLQYEILAQDAYLETPAETNILATVIWGVDGGQQSAQISIGAGVTFSLTAQYVRISVLNPLLSNTILVSASASPGAYAPNVGLLNRLVYLQGALPIIAGPFAGPVLMDGVSQIFKVPRYARRVSYATLSLSGAALNASDRVLLTQLVNSDAAVNILRVDDIPHVSYPSPESPGMFQNIFQLDHIPLNPSCNGFRIDVNPSGDRFSAIHKLTFELGL